MSGFKLHSVIENVWLPTFGDLERDQELRSDSEPECRACAEWSVRETLRLAL